MTAVPPPVELGTPLPQPASPETLAFLARRRSASAVLLAEPAPGEEELALLLRLAARVPDHGKIRPWRFIVLKGEAKTAFAARLEALANGRGDTQAAAKLAKLKTPPLAVAVVYSPRQAPIPEWEQILSAGAVCTNLLYAATAMGYGANWITDWYAYDAEACAALGLTGAEQVAGFVFMGSLAEPPVERERPQIGELITYWAG